LLNTKLIPKIANITDEKRVDEIFAEFEPELVFHAAAHKHVPLVEQNVGESIINNVLGTKVVADAADRYGTSRFVMVSTDKAVNPTSIMGCTKQMAERYCQALDGESETMFISTRFGNVLGSAGSVVPLFQEQISRGGPITITDKRMTRYFMTIPEASQLVIQAGSMGRGGEVFVLEMGKPVKILDLAKDLIRLAGHSQDSIEIVETGMRPGEKLFEELSYENEESIPTKHKQILSLYSRLFSREEVSFQVQKLVESAFESPEKTRALMVQFIPEFIDGAKAKELTADDSEASQSK
jgi:FlaA1/EpsC-like NDP-sugar epimerase